MIDVVRAHPESSAQTAPTLKSSNNRNARRAILHMCFCADEENDLCSVSAERNSVDRTPADVAILAGVVVTSVYSPLDRWITWKEGSSRMMCGPAVLLFLMPEPRTQSIIFPPGRLFSACLVLCVACRKPQRKVFIMLATRPESRINVIIIAL